jgi:hypothetical protein
LVHPGAVQLDVDASCFEHWYLVVGRPLEVAPQVVAIGVDGRTAVAGQGGRSGELDLSDTAVRESRTRIAAGVDEVVGFVTRS